MFAPSFHSDFVPCFAAGDPTELLVWLGLIVVLVVIVAFSFLMLLRGATRDAPATACW